MSSDDLDRRLRAIADHTVAQSRVTTASDAMRAATTTQPVRRTGPRRPAIALGALAAVIGLVVGVVLIAGDGSDGTRIDAGGDPSATTQAAPDASPGAVEYGGNVTVLESPQHGPQLCTEVEESLPPQCGGPDIVGWDWTAVDTEEALNGTTWGSFYVVGTWVDGVFSLTHPATDPVPTPPGWQPMLTSPCRDAIDAEDTPVVDVDAPLPEESAPDFAGSWWDATNGVYNVAFTGDLAVHEAALQAQYEGRLCVVEAAHTYAELLAAQERLMSISARPLGVVIDGVGIDVVGNAVMIDILVLNWATVDFIEQHLDGIDYGTRSALVPVDSAGQSRPGPGYPLE
jgi:hypothetical protein